VVEWLQPTGWTSDRKDQVLSFSADWIWDSWFLSDGPEVHGFFLCAPRSLGDPELRHVHARVGHAVTTDLISWRRLPDALGPGASGSFDEVATWTGSVVPAPAGGWVMYYTGAAPGPAGLTQSIGRAVSPDLITWSKDAANPVLRSARRWYESASEARHGNDFRDPWVFADPAGAGWHMLLTARAAAGALDDRGVIAHAFSTDLSTWELRAPLAGPGLGFSQFEVIQTVQVADRFLLVFSCFDADVAGSHLGQVGDCGVWVAYGSSLLGPWDFGSAHPLTGRDWYSGRLVQHPSSDVWSLLAFENRDATGGFGGRLSDPMPVSWRDDRLRVGR
jgi:beta-fructofuranosidase